MHNRIRSYIRRRNPPLPKHIADLPDVLQKGLWNEVLQYYITEKGASKGKSVRNNYNIEVVSIVNDDGFVNDLFYTLSRGVFHTLNK